MSAATFAFQGAPGAFSQQAAMAFAERIGVDLKTATFLPCQTFGEVFGSVINGEATYGAIPLENSSIGSIAANYDLLWSNEAFIIAEHFLPVHHNLIAFPGVTLDQIRTVYSHPAALDQCRKLFKHHPQMVARVHWDTSGAVADVKNGGDKSSAAIAGELAAVQYKMEILLRDVEDFEHNATRFGLIERNAEKHTKPKDDGAGVYKMSYALQLSHKVGSLASVLDALAQAGANLTKIESRPIGETPWHYRFFIDTELQSADQEAHVGELLNKVAEICKPLGRYPAALLPAP